MHFLVGSNGGTEAMTILNSGNVGIGTTGPTKRLTVAESAGIPVTRIIRNEGAGSVADGTVIGELQFDAADSDTQASTVDAMGLIRTISRASISDGNKQADMAFLFPSDILALEIVRI